MSRPRLRRLALGAGGVLAAALIAVPSASADFTLAPCAGAAAPGRGASFQRAAQQAFTSVFVKEGIGCGTAAGTLVPYDSQSSGIGRRALGEQGTGNATGARDATIRWAGSDEPPTQLQTTQMERGETDANGANDLSAADNGDLHVIPVAIGAIAIIVNLPADCNGYGTQQIFRNRPVTTLVKLEAAFAAAPGSLTWGDLFENLPATGTCKSSAVKRVTRSDSSGSTYALRQLLAKISPARAADWRARGGQTQWPNTDNSPIIPSPAASGSSLAQTVDTTPGSLGYVDLATARTAASGAFLRDANAYDAKFWLSLQASTGVGDANNFGDPQLNSDGYLAAQSNVVAKGANCGGAVPENVPSTPIADPTLGDWSAVDSTMSGAYPGCTLTYDLLFDDNSVVYCNSAAEEAKARTIKDYFTKAVVSADGQQALPLNDYAVLPGNILARSQAGVAAIGWNKGGQGRPCPGAPPVVTPTPTPTPGTGTTTPPPPPPPSNTITIPSARTSGTTIKLSVQCPGPGKLSIASSAKPKKGKAVTLSTKTVNVTKSGAQAITLSLNSKAKSALKKDKKLKFTIKVTYTPTGGAAKTFTKSVTIKQPKKASK